MSESPLQSSLPVILGATTYNGLLAASDRYVATGGFGGLSNIYPFYFRGRATLTPECPELTRPAYSSIRFGGSPAALMTEGAAMTCGIW